MGEGGREWSGFERGAGVGVFGGQGGPGLGNSSMLIRDRTELAEGRLEDGL